ncbi:MAG: HD domain-containing protein [Puniceicoccales bacterium]|jgi:3'-5' exoribonuclease|nr:HD domain-containing protein [Puniceicoccales bacterium]
MPKSVETNTTVQTVKTLSQGNAFTGTYILRKRTVKNARNGSPFLSVELGDKTGAFSTTVFSDSPLFDPLSEAAEGSILKTSAAVDFYQGRFAPRLTAITELDQNALSAEEREALIESSPEDAASMWDELLTCVDAIPCEKLRAVTQSAFNEICETFRTAAAAVSMHHAYLGGLLEHTLHVARAARALLPLYPQVDSSLALAGALLHDIGKTLEYTQPPAVSRTRTGILHGHVVLGYQLVRRHGLKNKLPPTLLERLEHIILSHQGELEWGAAVMAATPEAVFVSMVDNLDAKMGMVQRALRTAPEGTEFSDFLPGLKAAVLLSPPETDPAA